MASLMISNGRLSSSALLLFGLLIGACAGLAARYTAPLSTPEAVTAARQQWVLDQRIEYWAAHTYNKYWFDSIPCYHVNP